MVEFLNKDKAYAEIVDVVSKAVNKLILISPYIRIPSDLLERLKYMDKKGVKTTVVCREKDLNDEVRGELKQLRHLELRFDEDLHAKCFYNEESMVITSLNLHEHSQQHNREMGILLNSKADSNVFKEALDEAEFIVGRAKKDNTMQGIVSGIMKEAKAVMDASFADEPRKTRTQSRAKLTGYCIRCDKSIPYNSEAPYCSECYSVWVKYKDPDYEEKFCHQCGSHNTLTTMNKPLCNTCFKKSLKN